MIHPAQYDLGQTVYTAYAYDLAGDLLAVYKGRENAQQNRSAQRMVYDAWGNITSVEDGNGNQTGFRLDDWGRIIEIHTPEGGTERYIYDHAGNITSTTDANGGTITYAYNSMGRVCQTTDQEGFSEYFYYDEEGRLETRIDRNGNKTTTHYNMDGNLFYQRAEDKKGRNPVVSRYLYYPDGKLRQAEGGGITYDYAYTPNGLLKSKSASGKPLLEYAYDRSRNLSCLTDSAGNSLHYTYDAMNRLKQVSEGQEDILASYSYNPFGGLCRLQYGNGIQTEYGYNDSGTLSSLVTVTKQGQVLLNFDYAYDGNGNCIQKSGAPYQNTYAYDCMNRLLEAVQDGKTEKYTYDLAGNRLKKESGQKTEIYEYNAKKQLTGIQSEEKTIQYRYDPQGNLLEELGRTWKKRYAYDAANHQKDIELTRMSDGRAEYCHQSNRYDAEGLRYETKEDGNVIRFLFDRGELAEEIREDAHIRYTRGYDPLSLTWNGAEKSYFVPDEMGSTLFLLDKDHEIQKTYRYDAFGAILNESGDTFNRLTYTGQMYDGAMGQYYLRARFYNPSIGRFMQEDIYRGDGLNLYAYCANNPVMYFDPSGYMSLCKKGKLNPATEITLEYVEGMDKKQFYRKANELKILGEQGFLYKAENPVQRDPTVTRNYRQGMIDRIWNQYHTVNPEFADALINRVTTRMQPDHIWELQLGGPDIPSNLRFLDSFTNWHVGSIQIRSQIRNLPTGTPITIKIKDISQ